MSDTGVVLHPGQQISEYRVEKLLSESGLDRVYLAAGADGQVVIKVPRFEPSLNAEFLRRFERQAATAARVSDPHVVRVLGSGQLPGGGAPFIIEEYVGGGSLLDLVALGPLEIDAAVRICADAASGLDALHAQHIVHRSLTPSCVLLDSGMRAKIGGFALAKDRDATRLTQAGHTVGAAHYIAPEQIHGDQVSPATDVYALGCVLFEALTGRPPFASEAGMKVLWAHLQTPPPDPCSLRPEIPRDLAWALARALAKKPEERPASATTFARIVQIAWEGARSRDTGTRSV